MNMFYAFEYKNVTKEITLVKNIVPNGIQSRGRWVRNFILKKQGLASFKKEYVIPLRRKPLMCYIDANNIEGAPRNGWEVPFKGSQISPWQPYNFKWRFTIVVPIRIGNIAIYLFFNQIGPICTNLKYKMLVRGLWRLFTRICLIHKIIGLQSLARNLMEWWKGVLTNDYFKMAQWRMEKVK